ncbi:MAG: glycosyltransferase [Conexivisphaerales archaeon]
MKRRWYFSVYGGGLGHISRSLWVADAISGQKFLSTWGEALDMVNSGTIVLPSTPLDVVWSSEGRMSFRSTIKKFYSVFSTPAIQISEEVNRIKSIDPDVVISDSRISPIIASRICNKPSALIINQARVLLPLRGSVVSRELERLTGEFLSIIWGMSDLIMVPDLPPPYTISHEGIYSRVVFNKLKFFGFFSRRPTPSTINVREKFGLKERVVYAAISGPRPTRDFIIRLLEKAGRCLPTNLSLVISEGSASKVEAVEKHGNVLKFGWDSYRNDFLNQADAVILRAGLTTMGEVIMAGKPMMLFPIALHGEQISNASRAKEMGIARIYDQYSTKPETLCNEMASIIDDSAIKRRVEFVSKLALSVKTEEMVKNALEGIVRDDEPA